MIETCNHCDGEGIVSLHSVALAVCYDTDCPVCGGAGLVQDDNAEPDPSPSTRGTPPIEYPDDPVIEEVLNRIKDRADAGMIKYGVSMMRKDIDKIGWIDHAIEELMDAINYLTRLKHDLKDIG